MITPHRLSISSQCILLINQCEPSGLFRLQFSGSTKGCFVEFSSRNMQPNTQQRLMSILFQVSGVVFLHKHIFLKFYAATSNHFLCLELSLSDFYLLTSLRPLGPSWIDPVPHSREVGSRQKSEVIAGLTLNISFHLAIRGHGSVPPML